MIPKNSQHAENCLRLAKEATTEEARKTFVELANKWMMLVMKRGRRQHRQGAD